MDKKMLDRINELAKKKKEHGLTDNMNFHHFLI